VLHALTLAGLALVAGAASAAAVGLTISEVDWANDISGTPMPGHTSAALTEQLLLSLRNATSAQVLADMGDKGGHGRRSTLRFHSDGDAARGYYSGRVRLNFGAAGRVSLIQALVNRPDRPGVIEFLWSFPNFECSDFPASRTRCN
jgi:hypothetical protein